MPLTNGPLSHMLRNRIYLGEINHKGQSFPGDHAALVAPDLFAAVQERLGGNTRRPAVSVNGRSAALLLGRIFDDRGHPMSPSHAVKGNIRYRYYVSSAWIQGRKAEAGSIARVPALLVENTVTQALLKNGVMEAHPGSTNTAITSDLLAAHDLRVEVHAHNLQIHLNVGPIRQDRGTDRHESPHHKGITIFDPDADVERQTVLIPFDPHPRKRQREILLPDRQGTEYIRPLRQKEQQNLIRSIALAKSWVREIKNGAAVRTIASREDKTERAIRMNLSLAFLDPKLVKAVMHGTLPRGVSARRLVDAPATWNAQWQRIGLSRPG